MQPGSKGFVSVLGTPVGPAVRWGLTCVLLVAGCRAWLLPSSVFGSISGIESVGQGSSSRNNLCRDLLGFFFFFVCVLFVFFFFLKDFSKQTSIGTNLPSLRRQEKRPRRLSCLPPPPCCAGGDWDGGMQGWRCRALQPAASSYELGLGPVPGSVRALCIPHPYWEGWGVDFPSVGGSTKGCNP